MFGKPKFSDAPFLLKEFSNGMSAVGNALAREHPDASPADIQALTVWVFTIILHTVLSWGRADDKSIAAMFHEFGSVVQQAGWDLDKLSAEIERCQRLLRTHVSALNYDGVKEAASNFHAGLREPPSMQKLGQGEFLRYAVTAFLANVSRLNDSGHIKLR